MLKKLINILKRKPKEVVNTFKPLTPKTDKEVELIYVDKFNNHWYTYKNVADLPYSRHISAELSTKQAEFNMTKDDMFQFLDEVELLINEQKYTQVAVILNEWRTRLEFAASENTLLDLALVFSLLNDEDADQFLNTDKHKKMEVWKNDEECKNFFLQTAFEITKTLQTTYVEDIVGYLKTVEQKLNRQLIRARRGI